MQPSTAITRHHRDSVPLHEIMGLIVRSGQAALAAIEDGARRHNLSTERLQMLRLLEEADASPDEACLTPSDLSLRLGISPSSTSKLLERLVTDNMVERECCPADRRRFNLRLTETGRRVVAQALPESYGRIGHALADFGGEELARLAEQLKRFCDTLEDGEPPVAVSGPVSVPAS